MGLLDLLDLFLVLFVDFAFLFVKDLLGWLVDLLFGSDCHLEMEDFAVFCFYLSIELVFVFLQVVDVIFEFCDFGLEFEGNILWLFIIEFFLQLNNFNLVLQLFGHLFFLLHQSCFNDIHLQLHFLLTLLQDSLFFLLKQGLLLLYCWI